MAKKTMSEPPTSYDERKKELEMRKLALDERKMTLEERKIALEEKKAAAAERASEEEETSPHAKSGLSDGVNIRIVFEDNDGEWEK